MSKCINIPRHKKCCISWYMRSSVQPHERCIQFVWASIIIHDIMTILIINNATLLKTALLIINSNTIFWVLVLTQIKWCGSHPTYYIKLQAKQITKKAKLSLYVPQRHIGRGDMALHSFFTWESSWLVSQMPCPFSTWERTQVPDE